MTAAILDFRLYRKFPDTHRVWGRRISVYTKIPFINIYVYTKSIEFLVPCDFICARLLYSSASTTSTTSESTCDSVLTTDYSLVQCLIKALNPYYAWRTRSMLCITLFNIMIVILMKYRLHRLLNVVNLNALQLLSNVYECEMIKYNKLN